MNRTKVSGKQNKHDVLVYALSTCGWCRMAKQLLKDKEVTYDYVDVDLCNQEDKDAIKDEIVRRGGDLSFPVIIVDGKVLISGFDRERIEQELEL